MYWESSHNWSSEQVMHRPLGGMALRPRFMMSTISSRPFSMRGAQASASPGRGAPWSPVEWQAKQNVW